VTDLPALATPTGDVGKAVRDPKDATLRDLVNAYVSLGALQDALEEQRKRVKNEVHFRAASTREETGAEFKAPIGDIGSASDKYHAAQVIVDDPEACAAWLYEHHRSVYDAAVEHRTGYDINHGQVEVILADLRRFPDTDEWALNGRQAVRLAAQLEHVIGAHTVTIVLADVLEQQFMKAGEKLMDVDGQVVEGVRVVPRRFKWVEIRGDKTYAAQLKGMFTQRLTRTPELDGGESDVADCPARRDNPGRTERCGRTPVPGMRYCPEHLEEFRADESS
jgi:hypothetical protein